MFGNTRTFCEHRIVNLKAVSLEIEPVFEKLQLIWFVGICYEQDLQMNYLFFLFFSFGHFTVTSISKIKEVKFTSFHLGVCKRHREELK